MAKNLANVWQVVCYCFWKGWWRKQGGGGGAKTGSHGYTEGLESCYEYGVAPEAREAIFPQTSYIVGP